MSDLSRISGVGPKREKLLAAAGIRTLRDLIYHLPRRYIDRTRFTPINALAAGKDCVFTAEVVSITTPSNRMLVTVEDTSGSMDLVFFNGIQFLRNRFKIGQRLAIAGVPSFFRDQPQLVHPEFEVLGEGEEYKGAILPRYPLTMEMAESRVEHKFLQKAALEALESFAFSDPVEERNRVALGLIPEADMLRALHRPAAMEELPPLRRQLKVRELLPLSLRLAAVRRERARQGRAWPPSRDLAERLRAGLPFALTAGQSEAVAGLTRAQGEKRQFF
ncbi:MAG TPA: OB-fold nucleic acid binding domain-containing protein, partial [Fibrobacteria bacterium]|nr:OB-fold nucleic acid binding domain-containing protein [Fibrobacteria bacterium]